MDGWLGFALGAAFLAGLTGGVHCAAMCGPLVGVSCGGRAGPTGQSRWLGRALAYNAGRITSYSVAGALTGALGAGGLALRGGPAAQQVLLVLMSACLIL